MPSHEVALVAQAEAQGTYARRSLRRQELETAKEILAEVYSARPADVEERLQWRLGESCRSEEGDGRRRSA